jgi:thioredoxin-dependent peroxiredoxin
MKAISALLTCSVFAAVLSAQQITPPKTNLKIGDEAPDFTLKEAESNKDVKLSDFRGKNVVVLAFFPAAFTGGCTHEITTYQSGISKFNDMDVQVLAISTDFGPTLAHWKKELNVSYPMLSDHMRKVSELYGVLIPEMGLANRTTFIVDTNGKIVDIQEGKAALDPSGAEAACSRLKHK